MFASSPPLYLGQALGSGPSRRKPSTGNLYFRSVTNMYIDSTGRAASAMASSFEGVTEIRALDGRYYAEISLVGLTRYQSIGLSEHLGEGFSNQIYGIYFDGAGGFSGTLQNYGSGNNHGAASGFTFGVGGTVMFAIDTIMGYLWVGYEGVWFNGASPKAGTVPTFNDVSRRSLAIRVAGSAGPGSTYGLVPPRSYRWQPSGFLSWPGR